MTTSDAPKPRRTFLSRLLWVVALVVCVIVVAIFLRRKDAPLVSTTLADGRILQIEAISYGTNHLIGRKSPMLDSLGPWFPKKVRDFLSPKYPHSEINLREPALVVWVNALDAKTRKHVDCQGIRLEMVDDRGDLFGEETRSWFGHQNFWRVGHVFSAFPRNQSTLTIQITPWKKGQQSPSIVRLRNPYVRKPEVWAAGSAPQSTNVEDVEVVLAELIASTHGGTNRYWETPARYWKPRWELLRDGSPTLGWVEPEWSAEDSFGNRGKYLGIHTPILRYTVTVQPSETNADRAVVVGALPTVAVNGVQSNVWWQQTFQFGTNDVIALGCLPPGTHVFLDGVYQSNPPVSMGPVGGGAPSGWVGQAKQINPLQKKVWRGHYTPVPTIYVRAESLPDKQRWAVRLRDEQGRIWAAEPEPQGHPDSVRPFLVKVPAEVQTVTPEIIVLKPLRATFTVKVPEVPLDEVSRSDRPAD